MYCRAARNRAARYAPVETIATEAEEKRYGELQQTAIDFARSGETESLAAMLSHGLPVNLADAKGSSLLMLANDCISAADFHASAGAETHERRSRAHAHCA